jgi:hypothetical protein
MVHKLFIDLEKAHETVRGEVFSNILNEFGTPVKLVRLIKMRLKETYNVCISRNLLDAFHIWNDFKEDAFHFQLS